jgi:hypothetical protein
MYVFQCPHISWTNLYETFARSWNEIGQINTETYRAVSAINPDQLAMLDWREVCPPATKVTARPVLITPEL